MQNLLQRLNKTNHPMVKASELTRFIVNALKSNQITLYEAYLLNGEVINYTRDNYFTPAWNGRVQISTCLKLYNQWLMALVFKDEAYAKKIEQWYLEAIALNKEKRKHYILDRANEFLEIREYPELLQELIEIREKYDVLNDNNGPYHVESFPFGYCNPELLLYEGKDLCDEVEVGKDVSSLLIELSVWRD